MKRVYSAILTILFVLSVSTAYLSVHSKALNQEFIENHPPNACQHNNLKSCLDCNNRWVSLTCWKMRHSHDPIKIRVKSPSCDERGFSVYRCICGVYSENTLDSLGHRWGVGKEVKASCESDGYIEYVCICGESYIKEVGKATGHTWFVGKTVNPSCTKEGYTEYRCSCGKSYRENLEAKNHCWEFDKLVSPTCSQQGYTLYKCSCGVTYKDDYTASTGCLYSAWYVCSYPSYGVPGYKKRVCAMCSGEVYESIPSLTVKGDYIGRFVIDSVGVDVSLVLQEEGDGNSIVDAENAAAYIKAGYNCTVIGDHNYQGFDSIKGCTRGDIAEIQKPDGSVVKYKCVDVIKGHNKVYYLSDADGNNLYKKYEGSLLCYTCNSMLDWTDVTVVVFMPY